MLISLCYCCLIRFCDLSLVEFACLWYVLGAVKFIVGLGFCFVLLGLFCL